MLPTGMEWYKNSRNILNCVLYCPDEAEYLLQEREHVTFFILINRDHSDLFQIYIESKLGVSKFCTVQLEYLTIGKVQYYICGGFIK